MSVERVAVTPKLSAFLGQRAEKHALLIADSHNPIRHLERGIVHASLGFPDLAAADAYRALELFDSVIDPDANVYQARRRVDIDGKERSVIDDFVSRCEHGGEEADNDDKDNDEEEQNEESGDANLEPLSQDDYDRYCGEVYLLLVRSLARCGCMRDAYEFCVRALSLPQCASVLGLLRRQLNRIHKSVKTDGTEGEQGATIDPAKLPSQGYARRVMYPWNTHEPDREAPETLNLLNARLEKVAPKCEVRSVALPLLHGNSKTRKEEGERQGRGAKSGEGISVQLGLVAKEDIAPGEVILRETSFLTATNRLHDELCDACNGRLPELSSNSENNPSVACEQCLDTIFCSQACHDQAQALYHPAVCGQEALDAIGRDTPDPRDKADYLYFLLVIRAIAMARTQGLHPLDLPEVKYIWGDFHDYDFADNDNNDNDDNDHDIPEKEEQENHQNTPSQPSRPTSATLPFSFALNILQPMRVLDELGLDPFAPSLLQRYDTWVINTLYAKFRGTASGRLSRWDGLPEVSAVHPLWCLANHSCDPNVRWEWGAEITLAARDETSKVRWGGGDRDDDDDDASNRPIGSIRKGEEIRNHYCDVGLNVKERREWAMGALGGMCRCERCMWEAAHQ